MVAKVVEIVTQGTMDTQQVLNRFEFLDTDGVADPLVLCADFVTHWVTPLATKQHSSYRVNSIQWQQVYPSLQLQQQYGVGMPIVGALGGAPAATFVAATARWNLGPTFNMDATPAATYIRRGGKRIGGISQSSITGDQLADQATIDEFNAALNSVVAEPPDGWQLIVCHFPPSPAPIPPAKTSPRLPPVRYALVTGHSLKLNLGSQVSRKLGHGK